MQIKKREVIFVDELNKTIEQQVKEELDKRIGIEPPKILTKKDL